ncbi:protein ABHD14A-like [Falco biarmicus]|uniref:protein ABHD14A n=1 Tax=Falco peregrinus TaxID=8954 RepID=UPI000392EFD6|nr:protein ABHD14A [Falco peregrinus]XP_005436005.1 protein ABHD14A [Falco cherrug]XP_037243007.1 protein ABHD14A [Falco rusticolus]XP_056193166.1 protein ABHD14A-like [Falco biarmicus]
MPVGRGRLGLLLLGVLLTFLLYLLLPATQQERRLAGTRPEEGKRGRRVANTTARSGMAAGEPPVFYREASAGPQASGAASPGRPDVLFLHGQAFTSKTWEALGTLALLAGEGYRAVAIDLPGYGDSPPAEMATAQDRVAFLDHVLQELGIRRPVLVSPSMSGRFALPFLLAQGDRLAGFVPIAPVGTKDYTAEQYRRVQTPTLILYGDRDTILAPQALQSLRQLPGHRVAVVPDAGHACYLDKPDDFHRALLGFLHQLK